MHFKELTSTFRGGFCSCAANNVRCEEEKEDAEVKFVFVNGRFDLIARNLFCRASSPELWRANRTVEMIESEFGMGAVHHKGEQKPSAVAGKHIEERIRKRAEYEALAESGGLRPVSSFSSRISCA